MATFNNGESGLSVRTKINNVLQHADGTASELVINEAGADVNFRVESDTEANALFVDGGTGNVGIGTSSPSYKLDIASSTVDDATAALRVRRGGVSTNWSRIDNISGVLNFRQYDSSSPIIRWLTSTDGSTWSERMRITSTGNVGIGTSSPNNRLTVNGAIDISGTGAGFTFTASGSTPSIANMFCPAGNTLAFGTANTERLRVTSTGNVGIGTATPGSKLSIVGLPTSSAGLSAGDIWNDGGTLKIV